MRPRTLQQLARRPIVGDLLIHSRSCPHRLPPAVFSAAATLPQPQSYQRRTIYIPKFLSRGAAPARPDVPPGFDTLTKLVSHLDKKIGPAPTPEAVADAFAQLVKYWGKRSIHEDQAALMLRGHQYLLSLSQALDPKLMSKALVVLRGAGGNQLALVRALWKDLMSTEGYVITTNDMYNFVAALCNARHTAEATELCMVHSGKLDHSGKVKVWESVLEGHVRERKEKEMLETLEYMRSLEEGIPARIYYHPIAFYCGQKNLKAAKVWYEKAIEDGKSGTSAAYVAIMKACLQTGQLGWGSQIMEELLASIESDSSIKTGKEVWDTVLQLSSAVGKGPEETRRLLELMGARAAQQCIPEPDVGTINGLISTAISRRDHGLVDVYLGVLSDRGIDPSHTTLELKLQSMINRGDLATAITTFDDLKFTQDVPTDYTGAVPQQLLRALAESYPNCDLQKFVDIYEDLVQMKVLLDIATFLPVLNAHLEEAAFENVKSLLNRHVGHFSSKERKHVINLLVKYAHRETTSIEAAWEAYLLLARSFPEMSTTVRGDMMNLFFELGKPHAAVRVLEHMSLTDDRKPTKYQYTAAFVGIANAANIQALQKAHRILNMDPFVDVDTILRNSLMNAYARCGLFQRAFFVYEEIERSPEGPDNATISQVFDMCGRLDNGGLARARLLWAKFLKQKISLTENNVASYVEALARHQAWDSAWKVVKRLEYNVGLTPGHRTLSTLFSTFRRNRLLELEAWLEWRHPQTWAEVKEELNATLNDELRQEITDEGYSFVDPVTREALDEKPTFKTSLNLYGSEGFDEEKAARDKEAWEKKMREKEEEEERLRKQEEEEPREQEEEEDLWQVEKEAVGKGEVVVSDGKVVEEKRI